MSIKKQDHLIASDRWLLPVSFFAGQKCKLIACGIF
jgi:hypothetical protein